MFNIIQIQSCFEKLVGFKPAKDPSYPTVIPELKSPITGMFVKHQLCTIENLYNACPEFAGFATNDSDLNLKFNNYLKEIYADSCTALVAKLIEMKKIKDSAKGLLEDQSLYSGFGFVGEKIIKHSRLVGFRIDTSKRNNMMAIINKIGFQVDTAQTVKFYLYHSSQVEAIATLDVVVSRANSFAWQDAANSLLLSYMQGNQNSDGTFYLAYYEDDVQGQVIKMDKSLQKPPCLSCSKTDTDYFNAWSKYIGVHAFYVETPYLDLADRTMFDESKVNLVSNTNFGINLNITTACDLTNFFCSNKRAFTNALARQIELDMINIIGYTTRTNAIADKTKGIAMADLDANQKSSFLNAEYLPALEALSIDFSGFDANCLPCQRSQSGNISAI